jgi:hypothetical protein
MCDAALSGNVQAMQLLLQHGADINGTPGTPWSSPYRGYWPLQVAVALKPAPATIQWMLEQGADAGQALAPAASAGNLPVLRLLLERGADISTWGGQAFRKSLANCQTEAACLLLGAGPPDYFMSAAPPHPEVVMDDLDHCVSTFLQQVDDHQASALLQAAVQHGHTGLTQMLQQRGVALPTGQLHGQDVQQEVSEVAGPG